MKAHRQLFASLVVIAGLVAVRCLLSRRRVAPRASMKPLPRSPRRGHRRPRSHGDLARRDHRGADRLRQPDQRVRRPRRDMDAAQDVFASEVEEIADGLGPVYNAQSCRECHQNPVTGAGSQITEFRAGHFNGTTFVEQPGGSLINDRAIDASIQERIAAGQEVRTFRLSLSIMGDGFVEAIDSNTLAGDRRRPARRPARHGHPGPGRRGAGHHPRRTVRLEEPELQLAVVRGRRLRQRDGHHQPAAADREHVQRQLGRRVRHRRRSRGHRAPTSRRSRCSCAR